MTNTLEKTGNPFLEECEDLLVIGTRDIADPKVANTIKRNIEQIGKNQYQEYIRDGMENRTKPLSDPIKQNKLHLCSRQESKVVAKDKQQITSLKQNCSLFSQLYVLCQVRDGNLDEFFRHKNQAYPPSLSQFEQLRLGSKSDLLVPLEKIITPESESPEIEALILDGAVIVNMLKPRSARRSKIMPKTFFYLILITN
ncbi:hypothetical protein DPMN_097380 [Dreissena polymorpha]|uniref:Uncharacterized protein n=1 Tax=Dreissena polymorpha TaxID=45954 RepID=A0A9D4LBM5_DREPO|nr:hypothetical protein DPMN_097380 [Dreissena polymorpha]